MVIKTTKQNTDKTIAQQLTEFMNKAFDSTVTKTLEQHKSLIELKESSSPNNSFKEKGSVIKVLFEFIHDWGNNSYNKYVINYGNAMSETNRSLIRSYLVSIPLDYCLDKRSVLEYDEKNNYSTVNSLLDEYKTFNGTVEQAVLSIIKPLLINGLIEDLIKHLGAITELVEVINNYNDNDYHLKRFVQALEKGMIDDNSYPFELSRVWRLWDEKFLKDRVIPFLKEQELTKEQLQKLKATLYKNRSPYYCYHQNDELLGINNYYDCCLAYKYAVGYYLPELKPASFYHSE